MMKMDTEAEMMTAVLHDTIEDSELTMEEVKRLEYPNEVIEALRLLTHVKDVEYFEYVKRCKDNAIARKVKLADAKDNADLTRIIDPQEKDKKRCEKYAKVIEMLTEEQES